MNWRDMGIQMAGGAAASAGGSIGSVIGSGLSRLFGIDKYNDKRQLTQQEKLTDIQVEANKELGDYSQWLERGMFDYTSAYNRPHAQVERLKEAGLNPALMYSGAPGQMGMTGGASAGQSAGSHASTSAETEQAATSRMAMGLQLGLMKSQIAMNEATANEANAKATYTAGAQTTATHQGIAESQARIDLIASEIINNELRKKALELSNDYQQIQNRISQATENTQINITVEQLNILKRSLDSMDETIRGQKLSNDEYEQTFEFRKAITINTVANIIASTGLMGSQAALNQEEKWAIGQKVAVQWADIINGQMSNVIKQKEIDTLLQREKIHLQGTLPGLIGTVLDNKSRGQEGAYSTSPYEPYPFDNRTNNNKPQWQKSPHY